MNDPVGADAGGKTFFGQPRGLATLFFTEMWERFTYYGMRALLVLFLVGATAAGGFGIDDKTATAIYGLYTAGVYLAALPGGWIADRVIGAQRAVIAGGVLITAGNAILALSSTPQFFYFGLAVIVCGVGLLKPNVSTIVAQLYPEGGARRDAGFTIFYIGINVGAMIGPVITAKAKSMYGDRAGFAAAGLFMALGVAQFLWTRGSLRGAGAQPYTAAGQDPARQVKQGLLRASIGVVIFLGLAAAFLTGLIRANPVSLARSTTYAIVGLAVAYFAYYFFAAGLTREEKRRGIVLVFLFVGCALFWSGFEQAGSSLNLFAERYTDRVIDGIGFVVPTEWFQSINSVFIMIFAPGFAAAWIALGRRNLDPSAPAKFALGLILMGSGFLIMVAAAKLVAGGARVLPIWLILTYMFHTWGELCLSPVGLSYFTKLTPQRFAGQMMGIWFLAISLGNLIAGLIAGDFNPNNLAAMPGQYLHIVYFAVGTGIVMLALSRPVKRLMGTVH